MSRLARLQASASISYLKTGGCFVIDLDIPRPRYAVLIEDMFKCPMVFVARAMTTVFDRGALDAHGSVSAAPPIVTLANVVRDRRRRSPRHNRCHLGAYSPSSP
jgi:hypothetical protein